MSRSSKSNPTYTETCTIETLDRSIYGWDLGVKVMETNFELVYVSTI